MGWLPGAIVNEFPVDGMDRAYYSALWHLGWRYARMAPDDLLSFVREFQSGVENRLPLLKLNRWLGYIQGVLCERGITTVETERDFTRPFFRPLDFP